MQPCCSHTCFDLIEPASSTRTWDVWVCTSKLSMQRILAITAKVCAGQTLSGIRLLPLQSMIALSTVDMCRTGDLQTADKALTKRLVQRAITNVVKSQGMSLGEVAV